MIEPETKPVPAAFDAEPGSQPWHCTKSRRRLWIFAERWVLEAWLWKPSADGESGSHTHRRDPQGGRRQRAGQRAVLLFQKWTEEEVPVNENKKQGQ